MLDEHQYVDGFAQNYFIFIANALEMWLFYIKPSMYLFQNYIHDINGLVQNYGHPNGNTLEVLQSCTKPSKFHTFNL